MKNQRRNISFQTRLKIFEDRKDAEAYGLDEYLDDCRRYRFRLKGEIHTPNGNSTSLTWLKNDKNSLALVTKHTDEFEAWLKLQL